MTTFKPFKMGHILYAGQTVKCLPYGDDDVRVATIIDVLPHDRWIGMDLRTKEKYLLDRTVITHVLRPVG